jgi:cytochrome c oxidase subunit 2
MFVERRENMRSTIQKHSVSHTMLATTALLLALASSGAALRLRPDAASLQGPPQQSSVEIRVTAERFSFTPSRITVAKGTIVEIVAESEDTTHGFHLADAGLDEQIPARGKGELRLRFEATEGGTYFFECSRPCGAGHNTMRGTIIVED